MDVDFVYYDRAGNITTRVPYLGDKINIKQLFLGAVELVDYGTHHNVKCFEVTNRNKNSHYNEVANYSEIINKLNCNNFCLL